MFFLLNVLFDLGKNNFVDAIIYTGYINTSIWVEESKLEKCQLTKEVQMVAILLRNLCQTDENFLSCKAVSRTLWAPLGTTR